MKFPQGCHTKISQAHEAGIIELCVLKKSGQLLPGHFDNIDKLVDEIERYDGEEDTLAIYTGLNRIKPEAFRPTNNIAAGRTRSKGADIARITGILFDLDPFRINGDPKDSTTHEEHQTGLEAAEWLRCRLSLMGWPEPLMGDSGNGGQLRYTTDLPATEESSSLVKRALEAANSILSGHLQGKVEVDTAMHDLPRVSKVFGTITRKGPGTQERPYRRSKLISAPEKLEIVQVDNILKLINAGRPVDDFEPEIDDEIQGISRERKKTLDEVENDPDVKPCIKDIVLNKGIKRLEEVSAHEHKGRVALATELLGTDYSNDALHEFFSRLSDYDIEKTNYQINNILKNWIEKGRKTWLCKTLRTKDVIPASKCQWCKWTGHGQNSLVALKILIEKNPREINKLESLEMLADLKQSDPIEFGIYFDELSLPRTAKPEVKKKIESIAAELDEIVEKDNKFIEMAPEIKAKAFAIAQRGDPFKFLVWQARRNHMGDIPYQQVLPCSIASAASSTSNGIQPGSTGEKGSGKSDACRATYILVPEDHRIEGSLSPMSLFAMQEVGVLKCGMILFSDDVEHEPLIPIYKRSTSAFQYGTKHYTLDKNRDLRVLVLPPRQVWWLTSVESVANDQAFDRQYPISTDTTLEHKKRVSTEIAARRARKELRMEVDEGICVAQAILTDIFEHGPFKVLIPQALKANWTIPSDFRGQERFWDLVDALAILKWRQHRIDSDGWLIAEERDLIEASELFMAHKSTHASALTPAVLQLVGALMGNEAGKMTQKDFVEVLGISQNVVSQRLNSIIAKSPIIIVDQEGSRKVYQLNPNVDHNADYWKNIELIQFGHEKPHSTTVIGDLSVCYRYVIGML